MDTLSSWIPLDQQEVDRLVNNSKFVISERPNFVEVKRVIGFSEIRKYLPDANSYDGLYLHISDLKQAFMESDALFLSSLGYNKLEMLDIAPGDTTIAYRLRGSRKD